MEKRLKLVLILVSWNVLRSRNIHMQLVYVAWRFKQFKCKWTKQRSRLSCLSPSLLATLALVIAASWPAFLPNKQPERSEIFTCHIRWIQNWLQFENIIATLSLYFFGKKFTSTEMSSKLNRLLYIMLAFFWAFLVGQKHWALFEHFSGISQEN